MIQTILKKDMKELMQIDDFELDQLKQQVEDYLERIKKAEGLRK